MLVLGEKLAGIKSVQQTRGPPPSTRGKSKPGTPSAHLATHRVCRWGHPNTAICQDRNSMSSDVGGLEMHAALGSKVGPAFA